VVTSKLSPYENERDNNLSILSYIQIFLVIIDLRIVLNLHLQQRFHFSRFWLTSQIVLIRLETKPTTQRLTRSPPPLIIDSLASKIYLFSLSEFFLPATRSVCPLSPEVNRIAAIEMISTLSAFYVVIYIILFQIILPVSTSYKTQMARHHHHPRQTRDFHSRRCSPKGIQVRKISTSISSKISTLNPLTINPFSLS